MLAELQLGLFVSSTSCLSTKPRRALSSLPASCLPTKPGSQPLRLVSTIRRRGAACCAPCPHNHRVLPLAPLAFVEPAFRGGPFPRVSSLALLGRLPAPEARREAGPFTIVAFAAISHKEDPSSERSEGSLFAPCVLTPNYSENGKRITPHGQRPPPVPPTSPPSNPTQKSNTTPAPAAA